MILLKRPVMGVCVSVTFCLFGRLFFKLSYRLVTGDDFYADYLRCRCCYDLIPPSTKLVVFDTRLRASYLLVYIYVYILCV